MFRLTMTTITFPSFVGRFTPPPWAVRPPSLEAVRIAMIVLLLLLLLIVLPIVAFLESLPDITRPDAWIPSQSVVLRDRTGAELYRLSDGQDRTVLAAEQMPEKIRRAFIAIEDERFYDRGCIDVRAIGRALLANVHSLKSQGGSTITQQLVRAAFLSPEKTFGRKIREIVLACQTEHAMSKAEVLMQYLNWIPFGKDIYGISQASRRFFGVEPAKLTMAQAAVLASLPQRPTYFSPYGPHRASQATPQLISRIQNGDVQTEADIRDEEVNIGLLPQVLTMSGRTLLLGSRATQVLTKMEEQGVITRAERQEAEADLLSLHVRPAGVALRAPYFSLAIADELGQIIPGADEELPQRGVDVVTTIDLSLQAEAERIIAAAMPDIRKKYAAQNVAALVVDAKTREVLVYVGNADYFGSGQTLKIDMAVQPRQPGSSFKPLVYASAFSKGLKPTDILLDAPLTINGDHPQNYEGSFQGPLQAMQALARSRNIPAIRAYQRTTEDDILQLAAKLGAANPLRQKQAWHAAGNRQEYGWPVALGAAEVPLTQMVQAYTALANGGLAAPLKTLKKVTDADGHMLLPSSDPGVQVLDPQVATTLTAILSEPGLRPAGWWRDQTTLKDMDAAVKTGTSNICLQRDKTKHCLRRLPGDTWALGYSPDYVVGVWVGNADRSALTAKADGLNVAIPLWKALLTAAEHHAGRTNVRFAGPNAPWYRQFPAAPQPAFPFQPVAEVASRSEMVRRTMRLYSR